MIKDVILNFDYDREPVKADDIFNVAGDVDYIHVISLEAHVDTTELSLSFLGETFPNLRKLRLNNSKIPTIRDIGCTFSNLQFLSLARCNIESLDGIGTISKNLEELYLAFNKIKDCCDLMGLDNLKILDLEDNLIDDLKQIEVLSLCPKLKAVTLAGNPSAKEDPEYRKHVEQILPQLTYLDEKRLKPKSRPPSSNSHRSPRLIRSNLPPPIPSQNASEINSNISNANDSDSLNNNNFEMSVSLPPEPIELISSFATPEKQAEKKEKRVMIDPLVEQPPPLLNLEKAKSYKDDDHIMTEMLDDIVDDRPPSTRGFYDSKLFPSPKKPVKQRSVPKIVRPMSAKGRPY